MDAAALPLETTPFDLEAGRRRFAGLRVALVHDWLNGMRGGEKVLETIARLFPGAPIFTLLAKEEALSPALRAHPIQTSFLQGYPGIQRFYRHFLPLFPAAIEDFDLQAFDLVISTSHCVAKGIIPGPAARHFSYCHSPMRYAWDQEQIYFPKRRGPVARLRGLLLSQLRVWDVMACARVDQFWANSQFVAERIRRYYRRDAEVLPPPIDLAPFAAARLAKHGATGDNATVALSTPIASSQPAAASHGHGASVYPSANHGASAKIGDGRPFCLAVSALVPYKRLDLAIRACEALGIDLKIVGTGPEEGRLAKLCGQRSELLGRVSEEELIRLYQDAALFVQPGIEDFGMASVEALAAGTPVVAIDQGGIRDIVEPGVHGTLYPGFEVSALMKAIDTALDFRFNPLELIQRAEAFSVDNFLRRLVDSLDRHLLALERVSPDRVTPDPVELGRVPRPV